MSISGIVQGASVRKSGSLISFKILIHFEPGTTRIGRAIFHCVTALIADKPSDGRHRGLVLLFNIRASKTFYVYPPAIVFRITSCDRLPAEMIKPLKEGWIPSV